MRETLRDCDVLRALDDETLDRVIDVAEVRTFEHGERPFVLGQPAECFFVVLAGSVDLCVPISIQGSLEEVSLQRKGPGSALGWSAFVRPNRFRLTARAVGRAELAAMGRESLTEILASDPRVGCEFMQSIAELTAERLLTVQALWVRELQRIVRSESHAGAEH